MINLNNPDLPDINAPMDGETCGYGDNGNASAQGTFDGCLTGKSLAMVYSPCQEFAGIYTPDEGLRHGTIFMELEKPFYGARRLK